MLTSRDEFHSSIQQFVGEKKEGRFSLKPPRFLSSLTPQNILFISFSETVSDVAGKKKKGFKRALLCDTYE